jgi:hypothetical protein
MTSHIFHPDLMRHLAQNRFGSTGTVQHGTITQGSDGEPIVTYANDPLLTRIPCQVEPHRAQGDAEIRRPNNTVVTEPFDILLAGYYPRISVTDQLVVWPTQATHNILRVAHDDTRTYTTLVTEIVSG